MKISHRQLLLILRILYCLGIFFGIFTFIYELFIQHNILYSICYICYFLTGGAILYLLFARKRPSRKFAYSTFYAMIVVTVLFFLAYIYESATLVSQMQNELIDHIEHDKETNPSITVMIKFSRCCKIDDDEDNFEKFQLKYPETCGVIESDDAKSCLPFIRNQRNFTIFICFVMISSRILALFLLWKYLKDEYNDEIMDYPNINGEHSTATFTA